MVYGVNGVRKSNHSVNDKDGERNDERKTFVELSFRGLSIFLSLILMISFLGSLNSIWFDKGFESWERYYSP